MVLVLIILIAHLTTLLFQIVPFFGLPEPGCSKISYLRLHES